jgi:hypothetical protein
MVEDISPEQPAINVEEAEFPGAVGTDLAGTRR